jgi:FtsP/CotA-like multicopper oxidase with cupredoxin domain
MMNSSSTAPKNQIPGITPSRRRFMASALATALGVSLADILGPGEFAASAQTPPPGCAVPGEAFLPVTEFRSKNKNLTVNMAVKGATRSVSAIAAAGYQCKPMRLRYYEATDVTGGGKWPRNPNVPVPGPVLRVRVGDTVQVHLQNLINPSFFPRVDAAPNGCDLKNAPTPPPIYPYKDNLPSCFHEDNVTNLHYHGTHVTPDGQGDNVMIDVYPMGHVPPPTPPNDYKFTNRFTIPLPPPASNSAPDSKEAFKMGQAPGTHWYHAHKHGSVALQLLNGMSGALIIEGEFDDQLEALMPGLRSTEKVVVIQQIGETITIQPGDPLNTCAGGDPLPLVNGQLQPTIEMRPGEIQRWRLINATMQQVSHLTYRFLGEDVYAASKGAPTFPSNSGYAPAIRQIAYDGIQLAPERYNDANFGLSQEFTIAPANRVDILVQAPAMAGKSLLAFRLLHGPPPAGCQPQSLTDLFLLRLNVTGAAVSPAMTFPTASNFPAIPAWLQWNENDPRNQILIERTLNFNQATDPSSRPAINGKVYDHTEATTQTINLNTAEKWTLTNNWASSIHPFHIHVNPFQILEVFDPNSATPLTTMQAPYIWRDTIAIPAAKDNGNGTTTNGYVKIRSRFVDFPGTFVLHCHILDHEDRGMMQEVQILDPKSSAVPRLPMHH